MLRISYPNSRASTETPAMRCLGDNSENTSFPTSFCALITTSDSILLRENILRLMKYVWATYAQACANAGASNQT